MQGAANDGVGAVVQRLERRYVSVPPHEHRRCTVKVVGQLRRRSTGGSSVVSSGSMFGITQCLRNCSRKMLEGSSGESKNWPGKMSGEPNTA